MSLEHAGHSLKKEGTTINTCQHRLQHLRNAEHHARLGSFFLQLTPEDEFSHL